MAIEKFKIFDDLIEGVQVISTDYRYLYVNKAVAEQGKRSVEELTGNKMTDMYPGIENTEVFSLIGKCLEDGKHNQFINEFDFPDGSKGYFELRFQKVDEGVLLSSYDVTDQKRAEQIIKNTNAELEKLVALRVKEIEDQHSLIEQQLSELKELNKLKDKFFSVIAHDLKSPISTLMSFSDILKTEIVELDKTQLKEFGTELHDRVKNVLNLTDNLLEWAKSQMNQIEAKQEEVSITDILNNILNVYKDIAKQKDIVIKRDTLENINALGDAFQLEFVLRNLINNAVKFTKRGGLIEIQEMRHDNFFVKVIVRDSGIGMSKKQLDDVFSIKSTKSIEGTDGEIGTGLGLTLAHEFIQLNKGKIEVESEPDKGTTFSTYFLKV